ncbi:MAG: hypothetical protein WC102_05265 [Saccharofermentanales bacterium]|jgi:hypothetical protein
MLERPRIIDVTRKPAKCPVCGERVVDIIYGTGDMTESEFLLEYRCEGIMGGDNIPRRPPIWACSCGCKRFRKVNPDGTDAPVKVKLLKDVRKKPLSLICWTTEMASTNIGFNRMMLVHQFEVAIVTEFDEKEKLRITAVNGEDAEDEARKLVALGNIGLKGRQCISVNVYDK